MRLLLTAIFTLCVASPANAQNYPAPKPKRQFVTLSVDWLRSSALKFGRHPVEDLVGRPVVVSRVPEPDYETADGRTVIDLVEYRRRNTGFSAAIYPFGLSVGTTLGIRGSIETLPRIRINFAGEEAPAPYSLTGARAYDIGLGLYVADRSPGYGIGSMAFIVGGVGRIEGDDRDGSRVFAEGGGGVMFGPIGVQIAVKFARNQFDTPVPHRLITMPFTVRGTLSF